MNPRLAYTAARDLPPWIACIDDPSAGGGGIPTPAPVPAPPAPAPAPVPAGEKTPGPNGFPEETPLAEMTVDQREAYWKHQARKHEHASKAKDTELADLRPKAEQFSALEAASRTEAERAAAEAEARGRDAGRTAAEQAAVEKYGRALVHARFESALAGRMTTEQVETLVSGLNVASFLDADGLPDTGKVQAYVAAIPTATAPPAPKTPDLGGGRTPPPTTGTIDDGADLYNRRHTKRP